MFKIKPAARLALNIGCLTATVIWTALMMGFVPDPQTAENERQTTIARSMAVMVSEHARRPDRIELKWMLRRQLELEPQLISVGVRQKLVGRPVVEVGPHASVWNTARDSESSGHQMMVDINANGRKWGQLELAFLAPKTGWVSELVSYPGSFLLFVTATVTLLTWRVLGKTFRYLSPSKVVPDRVRSALDSISGGLALISPDGDIAHVNQAFCQMVECERDQISGTHLEDYAWSRPLDGPSQFPWERCHDTGASVSGEIVEAKIVPGVIQKYMVNASPIMGSKGNSRGMLVSFEDVTALESKKTELSKIIQTLRLSQNEVERKNEELSFLASFDPLTGCMNRRAFLTAFEEAWAEDEGRLLTVIMLDIDHFKSVNDNHGHSVGDEVLKQIGHIVKTAVGEQGDVCRYGGEEFVILLSSAAFEDDCAVAEKTRAAIQAEKISGLAITASLGISTRVYGASNPDQMLDQADQCLYVAKRRGRNQVIRFDEVRKEPREPGEDTRGYSESAPVADVAKLPAPSDESECQDVALLNQLHEMVLEGPSRETPVADVAGLPAAKHP